MAKALRQARAAGRAVVSWFRYELPEILAPASIPDPPGIQRPPRLTKAERVMLLRRAVRRYMETWDPEKLRQERAARMGLHQAQQHPAEQGPTVMEEFAAVAKSGSTAMLPFLRNLYQTRMAAYRDAVQQFVQGYKQGFQQAMQPEVPRDVADEMAAAKSATVAEEQNAAGQGQAPQAPPQQPLSSMVQSAAAAQDHHAQAQPARSTSSSPHNSNSRLSAEGVDASKDGASAVQRTLGPPGSSQANSSNTAPRQAGR